MPTPTDKERIADLEQQLAAANKKVESFEQAQARSTDLKLFVAEKVTKHFLLGARLKESLVKLMNGDTSKDNIADVLTAALFRFTRIGVFALLVAIIPIGILTMQTILLSRQNDKIDRQNYRLDQQTALLEAERRSAVILESGNVLDAISRELDRPGNIKDSLSNPLVGRIIALSRAMKPYKYLNPDTDTITRNSISPERGHLLISLLESSLGSNTMNSILRGADFTKADLRSANLEKAYLRSARLWDASLYGVQLSKADLNFARLIKADLSFASLRFTELCFADLIKAKLIMADLTEADLRATVLREADLSRAILKRANLNGADLRKTNLSGANLVEADLSFTAFQGADLTEADLTGVILRKTDLPRAIVPRISLPEEDLREEDLHETGFRGADLRGAIALKSSVSIFLQLNADTTGMIWVDK
ncbi:MAG: pentapeptide repeat-containing protein [Bacteroidota bacterium]